MSKKTLLAIRDLSTSMVIGGLSTYLPIWVMDKELDRFVIGLSVGVLVFYIMVATNKVYR